MQVGRRVVPGVPGPACLEQASSSLRSHSPFASAMALQADTLSSGPESLLILSPLASGVRCCGVLRRGLK